MRKASREARLKAQVKAPAILQVKTRRQWRAWLTKHHAKSAAVWLIIGGKDSPMKTVGYVDAVEEALCFGWIDSVRKKHVPGSHIQYFSKRKPNSFWSQSNRERVARLTKEGLMTEAGQALIDLAKKKGTWEALMEIEQGIIPEDLTDRLSRNRKAQQNFDAFSPSSKKIIVHWILSAKRAETRAKRIEETVRLAARNEKAYPVWVGGSAA